jgi:hypothetical protein
MKENLSMRRSVCLAVCVLLFAAPAFARTWNDTEGHSVEGDFVRVLKGKVVINSAGRMIQVPFGHLVEEDQDFVREELEKHGLGNQLPARKKKATDSSSESKPKEKPAADIPDTEKPAAADESKLGPTRTWTDLQGRSVQARFIGMEDSKVVLQVKGKRSTFPFDKFSVADQQYVRAEMTGRGEAGKVPAEAAPGVPAGSQWVHTQPPAQPPMGGPSMPRPSFPAPPEHRFPSVPTPAPFQPPPVVAPSFPAPVQRPAIQPFQPPSIPTYVNQPTMTGKVCTGCGKVVPSNLTAGDHCPHCGVFFGYDQTNGKRSSWGTVGGTTGGIGALVAIVVGLIARAWRRS